MNCKQNSKHDAKVIYNFLNAQIEDFNATIITGMQLKFEALSKNEDVKRFDDENFMLQRTVNELQSILLHVMMDNKLFNLGQIEPFRK